MENSLHLKIITPNKTFYDGDIDSVIVKTTGGERQILKNRRPFTAEIIEGNIKIKSKWNCTVGHLERLLNEVPEIDIPINIFINEWKEVLGNIIQGIKICGYDKFHAEEIQGLLECYAYIEESGILYK